MGCVTLMMLLMPAGGPLGIATGVSVLGKLDSTVPNGRTRSETVRDLTSVPLVAVIVSVYVPAAVAVVVATLMVDVPGTATEAGLAVIVAFIAGDEVTVMA